MAAASVTSPETRSTSSARRFLRSSFGKCKARTSCPSSSSVRTTFEPMKPADPVTSAFTRAPSHVRSREREVEPEDLALSRLQPRLPEPESGLDLADLVLDAADDRRIARQVVVELE